VLPWGTCFSSKSREKRSEHALHHGQCERNQPREANRRGRDRLLREVSFGDLWVLAFPVSLLTGCFNAHPLLLLSGHRQ